MSSSLSEATQGQLSISVAGDPTEDDAKVDRWELAASRRALKVIKGRLGAGGMMAMLEPDFHAGQKVWDRWLEESNGEFHLLKQELVVKGITVDEFEPTLAMITETTHFAMHPEHMVNGFDIEGEGTLKIGETEGDDFYKLFIMHFGEKGGPVETEIDPTCTYNFFGLMRNPAGVEEASVLHQFKDTPEGMYAKVCQWVPATAPDDVKQRVYQHLAIEFANLFRMAKNDGELPE